MGGGGGGGGVCTGALLPSPHLPASPPPTPAFLETLDSVVSLEQRKGPPSPSSSGLSRPSPHDGQGPGWPQQIAPERKAYGERGDGRKGGLPGGPCEDRTG